MPARSDTLPPASQAGRPGSAPEAEVCISINGVLQSCRADQDLVEVIRDAGLDMLSPCQHLGSNRRGVCKLCLVRVDGEPELQLACSTPITDGLSVQTDLPEIEQARKRNLEKLFDDHYQEAGCGDCIWDSTCIFHELASEYGLEYPRP